MSARVRHLFTSAVAFLAVIAGVITAPAASAAEPSSTSTLNVATSRSASDVKATAWPVSPPRAFPPDTPCYREEVTEPVYETRHGTKVYDFYYSASVCIFPDRITVYDAESDVRFPGGVQDQRLARVSFWIRNTIVPVDNASAPNDIYTYSGLDVVYCPDLPQPSYCEQYNHVLGLEFTRGWVYPIGRFDRIA